jgi:hypothetical protein
VRTSFDRLSGVVIIEEVVYINFSTMESNSRNNEHTKFIVLQSPTHNVVVIVHTSLKIEKPVKGWRNLLGKRNEHSGGRMSSEVVTLGS